MFVFACFYERLSWPAYRVLCLIEKTSSSMKGDDITSGTRTMLAGLGVNGFIKSNFQPLKEVPLNYRSRAVAKGLLKTVFCSKQFWSVL